MKQKKEPGGGGGNLNFVITNIPYWLCYIILSV
jgi:hypothetical protein